MNPLLLCGLAAVAPTPNGGASPGPPAIAPLEAHASTEDARRTYRRLTKEYRQAMADYRKELAALEQAGDVEGVRAMEASWHPATGFVELFAEAAEKFADQEGVADFHEWIVLNDTLGGGELSEACTKALDALCADHAASFAATLEFLGYRARGMGLEHTLAVLERVLGKGSSELTTPALLARGMTRVLASDLSDEMEALARKDFQTILASDVEGRMATKAKGYLFELDHLQVGMIAPEIEDQDLDGVTFKLSDYRGKVVMLDFWGDW